MSSISAASDDGKVVAALYHEREGEREANRNCPSDRSGFLTRRALNAVKTPPDPFCRRIIKKFVGCGISWSMLQRTNDGSKF